MNRAELERMTLEELYRAAAERGVREAAGLPREALIDRLTVRAANAGANAPSTHTAARTDGEQRQQQGAPSHPEAPIAARTDGAAPAAAPSANSSGHDGSAKRITPADRSRRAAVRGAMIPSGVAPDRPSEHDPEDMARLYLDQDEPARAADLYRELLKVRPDDESLVVGLAAAEARLRELTQFTPGKKEVESSRAAPTGEPTGMLDLEDPPESYGIDECEVIAKDPHHLFVYWEVTANGLAAARRDLGDEADGAKLVLRLIATAGPGEHAAHDRDARDIRDHHLDWNHGRRYFASPRPGARVRAAVGLLGPSGLFVPVAHSSQTRVPPSDPSGQVATEWMEVDPERTRGREREPVNGRKRGADYSERGVGAPGDAKGTDKGDADSRDRGSSPSSPWRWRPGSQS